MNQKTLSEKLSEGLEDMSRQEEKPVWKYKGRDNRSECLGEVCQMRMNRDDRQRL
jgi:hypothetical protein